MTTKATSRRAGKAQKLMGLMTALEQKFSQSLLLLAQEANQEYIGSSRGKGRGTATRNYFRPYSTYFPPSKRNGSKECARRLRQLSNGTHI